MNKEILKDISVLYVEDENDVREFTSKLLGSLLKKVYVAQNGLEGLELYKENQNDIDLIISDINMPKMDGLEFLEELRKSNSSIPFIFVTARDEPDKMLKAIQLDIDNYVLKPIHLQNLLSIIDVVVEKLYKETLTLENFIYSNKLKSNLK